MKLDDDVSEYYPQLSGKIHNWFGGWHKVVDSVKYWSELESVDSVKYWASLESVDDRLGLIGESIHCCFNDLLVGCDVLENWAVIPDHHSDVVWRIGCGVYCVCVILPESDLAGQRDIIAHMYSTGDTILRYQLVMRRFTEADFDNIIINIVWPCIVDICRQINHYGPMRHGFSI